MKNLKIRIIVPCYNEEEGIKNFYKQLVSKLASMKDFRFSVLFINDGSKDNTLLRLYELQEESEDVSVINLSKNFGKEIALTAGIHDSTNFDGVITMDADGQHPPKELQSFISAWQEGYDVVVGMRLRTENKSTLRRIGSFYYNLILRIITGEKYQDAQSTDFRLLDRKVVEAFCALGEHNRITRGLIDWLGFNRKELPFTAPSREFGEPTYSTKMLVRLAIHSFVSHSTRPLKAIGLLGIVTTLISAITEAGILIYTYILRDPYGLRISGSFHIGMLIIFMVGILLTCQGLIALYIENIYIEARDRPLYIINR